ncbi:dual specificity phosphatase 22 [Columba livia]|uniref:Dual specificity phosphatase 22 n=1 Tax=Columba livia TaxID=8932 RepID=A0A2I0MXU4_COLLI|nr:dual specificity phosphatase 22 [Columba livia]
MNLARVPISTSASRSSIRFTSFQILPGLFIGNFKDARDVEQLSKNNITHILSIHDSARPMLESEHDLKAPLHSACEMYSACAIASEICGTTCISVCWRSEPSGI